MSKQGKLERLQVGQGRAGLRRRKPDHINQLIIQPLDVTRGIPSGTKIETRKTNSTQGTNSAYDRSANNNNDPFLPDVPLHQDPLLKPSTLQNTNKTKVSPNTNLDFEEIHHFKKASYLRCFKDQTNHFSRIQKSLKIS